MTEAAQALDEIADAELLAAMIEELREAESYQYRRDFMYDNRDEIAKTIRALTATLRAALAPPEDGAGEVEAMRARHEACENEQSLDWIDAHGPQAHADRATLLRLLSEERDRRVEVEAEVADLKQTVIAFAGPAAARYALDAGFAKGELHPTHYDVLARCGARMVDFKRGEVSRATNKDTQDE